MGKLVAVIIFVCSAWTGGLDFLIRFTLCSVIQNVNLWPNYLSTFIDMVLYRTNGIKTITWTHKMTLVEINLNVVGHPYVRNHLIRTRIREIRFFRTSVFFRFFAFLSLEPLQYGCLWTRLDPTRSLVPVPRYCGTFSVLNGTFSVLSGTFRYI